MCLYLCTEQRIVILLFIILIPYFNLRSYIEKWMKSPVKHYLLLATFGLVRHYSHKFCNYA